MSLLTIAEIVFFLAFGISHFFPFPQSKALTAIAAIVAGVMMILA